MRLLLSTTRLCTHILTLNQPPPPGQLCAASPGATVLLSHTSRGGDERWLLEALAADFECEEISAQLQGSGRESGREGDSESGRGCEGESGRDCDPDEKPPEPACGGGEAATLIFCVRLAEPRPGPGGEEEEASPEEEAALAEYRAACERLGLRGV